MYRTPLAALILAAQLAGSAALASHTGIDPAQQITAQHVTAPSGTGLALPTVSLTQPESEAPRSAPLLDAAYRPVDPQTRAFA
ncbi:hypothetical protein [Pararhodobacter zhoushanensis]|uniref:Uncharacterized protein n=1 Tax=Pararhodobacter zhoushanensis TaxID=2479545 RepID=A0ABT3GZQ8_9RHOB|nr:hypothetical protein [Pararhodobacter zhoushanensis]MCW1933027.1 hypothetical protein [Pararhodobacter zhoushanensis]